MGCTLSAGAGWAGGAVPAEAPSRATPARARPRSPSSLLFGFYFSPWPFLNVLGLGIFRRRSSPDVSSQHSQLLQILV